MMARINAIESDHTPRARRAGGMYLPEDGSGARDSASEHVAEDDADGELGGELDAVDVAGDTV